jgi:polyketide cyclase/dehydrase/lipid transport protein/DUF2934 family protein
MGSTTHSIEVNAPLRVVYNQWTQFEEFPRFMESVDEVRQDGPKRLFWKAKIAGKDKQWEAEITEQVPDKRIAWVTVDGTPNTGEVTFESIELERTLITLTMEYEPEGFLEMAGDVLGIPSGQVEEDLERFRDFIEQTGRETGGWRGRIGEGPDSAAGAVREQGAQSVEAFDERTNRELTSDEAGIDRADEPTALAADRLGEKGEQQIEHHEAGATKPTDEQIARRAYELYLDRGQTPGHELEDWLKAEWELSKNWGE